MSSLLQSIKFQTYLPVISKILRTFLSSWTFQMNKMSVEFSDPVLKHSTAKNQNFEEFYLSIPTETLSYNRLFKIQSIMALWLTLWLTLFSSLLAWCCTNKPISLDRLLPHLQQQLLSEPHGVSGGSAVSGCWFRGWPQHGLTGRS